MSNSGGNKQVEEKKLVKANDSQKKIEAEIAAEVKKKTKGSLKFVFGYGKRECCSLILGVIFMIIASGGEIIMPIYIGAAIDLIDEADYDGVARLCGYMLIVIFVSTSVIDTFNLPFFFCSDLWPSRVHACRNLQHSEREDCKEPSQRLFLITDREGHRLFR